MGLFQFNIVAGILLAYLSNYLIGGMGGGAGEWRWKLGIAALPAALFRLLIFGVPQSPRWLAARGRLVEAETVLERTGEVPHFRTRLASVEMFLASDPYPHFALGLATRYTS